MICWRCKAAYDDSMPYGDLSLGAKCRAKTHNLGTYFKAQSGLQKNCQPIVRLIWFHLGHGMQWHHALCGLGVTQEVFGKHVQ